MYFHVGSQGPNLNQEAVCNWYQLATGKQAFWFLVECHWVFESYFEQITCPCGLGQHEMKMNSMVLLRGFFFSCFILFGNFLSWWVFVCLLPCFYFLFWGFLLLRFVFWKTENIKLGEYRGRCGGPGRSWGGEKHNQNMKYEENNNKRFFKKYHGSEYTVWEKSIVYFLKKNPFSYQKKQVLVNHLEKHDLDHQLLRE